MILLAALALPLGACIDKADASGQEFTDAAWWALNQAGGFIVFKSLNAVFDGLFDGGGVSLDDASLDAIRDILRDEFEENNAWITKTKINDNLEAWENIRLKTGPSENVPDWEFANYETLQEVNNEIPGLEEGKAAAIDLGLQTAQEFQLLMAKQLLLDHMLTELGEKLGETEDYRANKLRHAREALEHMQHLQNLVQSRIEAVESKFRLSGQRLGEFGICVLPSGLQISGDPLLWCHCVTGPNIEGSWCDVGRNRETPSTVAEYRAERISSRQAQIPEKILGAQFDQNLTMLEKLANPPILWESGKRSETSPSTAPFNVFEPSNWHAADFNGDGKTDVFASSPAVDLNADGDIDDDEGGKWLVKYNGTKEWQNLNGSNIPVKNLAFGDFNGDSKTDVFAAWDGKWRVSWSGSSGWQDLNVSGIPVGDLAFGDFNSDGKTDVFASWGGKWRVSWSGSSGWQDLNSSGIPVRDLAFGDFNGDGETDVISREF